MRLLSSMVVAQFGCFPSPLPAFCVITTTSFSCWDRIGEIRITALTSNTFLFAYLPSLNTLRWNVCLHLCEFPMSTVMKYCRLGSFNNRNSLLHNSGGWKSEMKVWAGLISPKVAFLGLQEAAISRCPHVSFLCVHTYLMSVCASKFPVLIRSSVRMEQDPP